MNRPPGPLRDAKTFAKAMASNVLARFAPTAYVRLTRQTGRGRDEPDPSEVVDYFFRCVADYREQLQLDEAGFADLLRGRRVLEYGPGDILGVALILYALGAATVHCVDRFPLERLSATNVELYRLILDRLDGDARRRAGEAFNEPSRPESGLRADCVRYTVTPDGLAGAHHDYDLIISRAVLEHVNSLDKTMLDVEASLAPDGLSIHNVDLKSHGLDRSQPFDFLAWPEWAYRLMYSHKGFPNRWRIDHYRRVAEAARLRIDALTPTGRLAAEDIERLRSRLARPFAGIASEDLRWMGFWMVLTPAAARAGRALGATPSAALQADEATR